MVTTASIGNFSSKYTKKHTYDPAKKEQISTLIIKKSVISLKKAFECRVDNNPAYQATSHVDVASKWIIALFYESHVIVTCRSVILALLGVGTTDAWNTVRVRFKVRVRVRVCCHVCCRRELI